MSDSLIVLRQQPVVLHLLCALWRTQQVFLRSQLFFSARTLTGPAALPDKHRRLQARHCADWGALLYDSVPLQRQLAALPVDALSELGASPRWGAAMHALLADWQQQRQRQLLDALRELSGRR